MNIYTKRVKFDHHIQSSIYIGLKTNAEHKKQLSKIAKMGKGVEVDGKQKNVEQKLIICYSCFLI